MRLGRRPDIHLVSGHILQILLLGEYGGKYTLPNKNTIIIKASTAYGLGFLMVMNAKAIAIAIWKSVALTRMVWTISVTYQFAITPEAHWVYTPIRIPSP